jgi:hypothetical protein
MAKRSGMYGRDKRQKELKRKKKHDEKQLKRQKNAGTSSHEAERTDSINIQPESSENASAVTDNNEEPGTTKGG